MPIETHTAKINGKVAVYNYYFDSLFTNVHKALIPITDTSHPPFVKIRA